MKKQKRILVKIFSVFTAAFFPFLAWAQSGGWSKSNYTSTGLPHSTALADIIKNVAMWLLGIFGFIAIIGFVISGMLYLLSAGDEDTQERAKRAMIYSITGVIVGLAGLVILYAVAQLLGGSTTF